MKIMDTNEQFSVIKVLNNNAVIVDDQGDEVILIQKGIGFNVKVNDIISPPEIDKMYRLSTVRDRQRYENLMQLSNESLNRVIIDAINYIQTHHNQQVDDRIILSLTDHIIFALKRLEDGLTIRNPFSKEIELLYPMEFKIAKTVIEKLNQQLKVNFPDEEVGFITLHIHSAINHSTIGQMHQINEVIQKSIQIIEHDLQIEIDKDSLSYARFVRHISFVVQRVQNNEGYERSNHLENVLKQQYPLCYNIAVKIMKAIQTLLNKEVYASELVYLTMHIQQFHMDSTSV